MDDVKKAHAVETLSIASRCLLRKNLTGWEVMEIFAGGVHESDKVFNDLTAMISDILSDAAAPTSLRHQVLQLAVILVAGISQLSPGAYFLRRDLFPCIVTIITSLETEQFTFEAALLLALLANFHKSDAAKLNPYLRRIRETQDDALMHKVCWASNFAADAVAKSYQSIFDDSPPTLGTTFGSLLFSLRPDRALAATPVDPPRELFKNHLCYFTTHLRVSEHQYHVPNHFRGAHGRGSRQKLATRTLAVHIVDAVLISTDTCIIYACPAGDCICQFGFESIACHGGERYHHGRLLPHDRCEHQAMPSETAAAATIPTAGADMRAVGLQRLMVTTQLTQASRSVCVHKMRQNLLSSAVVFAKRAPSAGVPLARAVEGVDWLA